MKPLGFLRQAAVVAVLVCIAVRVAAAPVCEPSLSARIPKRAAGLPTGSQFAASVASRGDANRDALILEQLLAGNVPGFLRRLKPVRLRFEPPGRNAVVAVICVMPDYLAIGSDADYLRVPLGLSTAAAAAASFGFVLPTPKMVDAIYAQSDVQLAPAPMKPGPAMTSIEYLHRHNKAINRQRAGARPGRLVAGHKKDVVLTGRLVKRRGRVAIYGWHQSTGRPIQPLSTVHGREYADYSHGVRLVSEVAEVDGERRSIVDVLREAELAPVLTREGSIAGAGAILEHASRATLGRRTARARAGAVDDVPAPPAPARKP